MSERDYLLGTHDAEIDRLGLQHRVWRPRVLDAWRRAGIAEGQTVIDVGAGPGYATLDLAEIVGPAGRVIAVERSLRFLNALRQAAAARGLRHVETREQDLTETDLGSGVADAAWCRWVLAFLRDPAKLVRDLRRAVRPGGVVVLYEYAGYRNWQLAPRSAAHDQFVEHVIAAWRGDGGDPDVGLALPRLLAEHGFQVESLRPHVEAVTPGDYFWRWPRLFVEVGAERLLSLGRLTRADAARLTADWDAAEATPGTCMITPTVLEIIARVP